jgi:prepilin-type N-terminal cleavage/methylation domain-containing protein
VRKAINGRRYGFTLIELLIAIAIIGILVAIAVPTAFVALRRAKIGAMKLELTNLGIALEEYRQKYGDYPPDGSDVSLVERHLRKAFPRILNTEFVFLRAACGGTGGGNFPNGVMNRAEAIVFFLGGFSSDPQRPLTGTGGPFVIVNNNPVYNTDRQNAIYEFGSGLVMNDEVDYSTHVRGQAEPPDQLPAFRLRNSTVPVAYFDSRTYQFNLSATDILYNSYENTGTTASFGAARPYLSTTVSTATNTRKYQNDKTFQLVCAGLDNDFGGTAWDSTVLFIFPTGESIPAGSARYNSAQNAAQLDNITNFSESTLEDGLTN